VSKRWERKAGRPGWRFDPTDPMNYDSCALRNDAAAQLYVHLCAESTCTRLDSHFDWVVVRPGSSDPEQVYWGAASQAVYAVATTPAQAGGLRCLTLNARRSPPRPRSPR
jgi:hypothetical protein